MFRRLPISLLFCLALFPFIIKGQETASLPKLHPSNISFYDLSGGLPVTCTWNGFMDHKGRLWVNPCFAQGEFRTIPFYQYDGTRSEMIHWDTVPEGAEGQAALKGMNEEGEFFGMIRGTGHFFFFNPDTRHTRFFQIDKEDAFIYDMEFSPTQGLLLFALAQESHLVYRFRENTLELLLDFPLEGGARSRTWHPDYASFPIQSLSGEELWLQADPYIFFEESRFSKDFKLLRLNLRTKALREFSVEEVFQGAPLIFPGKDFIPTVFASDARGSVYLLIWDQLYKIDASSGKANFETAFQHPNDILWDPSYIRSQKDGVGNLLFFFLLANHQYYGVLVDTAGHYFDYSAVLNEAVSASGYSTEIGLQNLASSDFKKHFLGFLSKGVIAADLRFSGSISNYIRGFPARAISEWRPSQYLVKTENRNPLNLVCPASTPAETIFEMPNTKDKLFQMEHLSDLVKTDDGYWWFSSGRNLVRLDSNANYSAFPVGEYFTKFAFLDRQTIALTLEDNQLYLYDLQTQRLQPWLEDGAPLSFRADVHQILPVNDSILWVASLQGLWRIDWKAGKSKRYGRADGFADERFMCIHPDGKGAFCLGTYGGGLHFFDPVSGSVRVIDQAKGLSNNTVIGILTDDDGDLWVSTYKGLNLVSPEGNVKAQFYQEDGLSNNEFNRFSSFKDSEGRLIFGTVNGINIIDPEALKSQLVQSRRLQIYLTGITYFDSSNKADHTQYYGFDQSGPIRLPAAHRHLDIRFALSSLIRPENQSFFFKIEKSGTSGNEDWLYLGNKPQLYLPSLPPGSYNILIRGRDFRGNWTQEPLVIAIRADEFFYKKISFYLLVFLVFSGIGGGLLIREIRQRRRLEQIVEERTQKIREDKELIQQQAEQLKELDQAKSRFFTNISHEFRTPLTIISGMVTQIRQHPDQWLEKGMELIQRNSNHLLSLINQILDLRKLESGALKIHLVQANIISYLRYIADSFEYMAQSKGIRIHFLPALPGLMMDYDPDKMLQILSNLLSNAIKFTTGPGDIYIQVDKKQSDDREQLLIAVRDTGQGITPEALPYIFDQFFQVEDLANQKPQGSGVGLALTRELVKVLNGSIEAASNPGEGTTFTLLFPINRQAKLQTTDLVANIPTTAPHTTESDSAPPLSSSEKDPELPTLLIVEDHPDVRLYLSAFLESRYQLFIAENGQEGIDLAIEQVPDLIVSDVMMPVKDGFELCDRLKNDERTSHIPIVLLTAKADFESKISGLRRGADVYLTKPFEQEELLVRLEQLLALRKKLQERYSGLHPPEGTPTAENFQMEDAFIQKLRLLVLDRISEEDFGVVQLCHALRISRTQLHNKVKALTNRSTTEFVRTIRLQKARELLQTTDLNVSEVGYEVGINNPAYFSRIYSEEFGEPPSRAKKK